MLMLLPRGRETHVRQEFLLVRGISYSLLPLTGGGFTSARAVTAISPPRAAGSRLKTVRVRLEHAHDVW